MNEAEKYLKKNAKHVSVLEFDSNTVCIEVSDSEVADVLDDYLVESLDQDDASLIVIGDATQFVMLGKSSECLSQIQEGLARIGVKTNC